jgi:hypothetical protein
MFYINQAACISPQHTFPAPQLELLQESVDNKLKAVEPKYPGIAPNALRRMSKGGRMGLGAAMPLLNKLFRQPDGIIIGTANGGMEESGKFLSQLITYKEEALTPGNFVQSTPNTIAAQISMGSKNRNYNITHVHRGLAFENAIVDAAMMLLENPSNHYLLGAADEIATYNFHLEELEGWYKPEECSNSNLYHSGTTGTIAGEGAAMFIVSNEKRHSLAKLVSIKTFESRNEQTVTECIKQFVEEHLVTGNKVDLLLSGENGDSNLERLYVNCETQLGDDTGIARFKHMSGEYPTASSFGVWVAAMLLSNHLELPQHMVKRPMTNNKLNYILIYNHYHGLQHSLILLERIN